ncbi:hypothetical protein ARMGADRAFT_523890 [Armillaria gallica]|uniref:Uncharacterized protein n=1 Tax=Armillaria gallica TaxID=47427 RepID=A0A2H3E9T2_ARMGA|nr:hypothetical protein ARMGADRAFT_523890 [Armillaria gallica]
MSALMNPKVFFTPCQAGSVITRIYVDGNSSLQANPSAPGSLHQAPYAAKDHQNPCKVDRSTFVFGTQIRKRPLGKSMAILVRSCVYRLFVRLISLSFRDRTPTWEVQSSCTRSVLQTGPAVWNELFHCSSYCRLPSEPCDWVLVRDSELLTWMEDLISAGSSLQSFPSPTVGLRTLTQFI